MVDKDTLTANSLAQMLNIENRKNVSLIERQEVLITLLNDTDHLKASNGQNGWKGKTTLMSRQHKLTLLLLLRHDTVDFIRL